MEPRQIHLISPEPWIPETPTGWYIMKGDLTKYAGARYVKAAYHLVMFVGSCPASSAEETTALVLEVTSTRSGKWVGSHVEYTQTQWTFYEFVPVSEEEAYAWLESGALPSPAF